MMKKCIIVLLLFCVVFSSCKKQEKDYLTEKVFDTEEYLPQYDATYSYNYISENFCETETACYGMMFNDPQYLHYYDKTMGTSGVLCGKVECMHNSWECNAYLPIGSWGLNIYDGHLYWIGGMAQERHLDTGCYVWRMDLDGNNREKVKTVSSCVFQQESGMNMFVQFHRGYLYASGLALNVVDGQAIPSVEITAEDIAGTTEEYVTVLNKEYEGCSVLFKTHLVGNNMYILISTHQNGTSGLELYQWNSKTRELITLYQDMDAEITCGDIWAVAGDGVYLSQSALEDGENTHIYKYDFETSELTCCFEVAYAGRNFTTATFANGLVEAVDRVDTQYYLLVMDMSGNVVCHKEIIVSGLDARQRYSRIFCGSNGEAFYYEYSYLSEKGVQGYMISVPLDQESEARILWSIK